MLISVVEYTQNKSLVEVARSIEIVVKEINNSRNYIDKKMSTICAYNKFPKMIKVNLKHIDRY